MPIEFYCPECDTFLRTPDSKAGASAKCPACSERIWVPFESVLFEEQSSETQETYRSQLPSELNAVGHSTRTGDAEFSDDEFIEETEFANETFEEEGRLCGACGAVSPWNSRECEACGKRLVLKKDTTIQKANLGDILSVSWEIYSKNLGICILAALVDFLLMLAAMIVVLIPSVIALIVLDGLPELKAPAFMFVLFLGFGVMLSALWIGHFRFFLQLARGQKPDISMMFHVGNLVGRMLAASFMASILIGLGAMMCVLPGLLVFVLLWPFGRVLVDQECSAFESLTKAYTLAIENFWCSVGIVTIFVGLSLAANSTIIGFLFSIPFNAVLFTVSYLHFSGEYVTGTPT